MKRIHCDVAIIGAGTAGLAAYRTAAAAGVHAVLIDDGPGGTTCARVGCMPSKALIAAARAAHDARRAGLFGVDAGPVAVDGAAVMARVRAERDYFVASVLEDVAAIPADRRLHGRARFTGPNDLLIDDDTAVTARAIVIAAGSSPVLPDLLAPLRGRVHTSDSIFELDSVPATLAVLGAGAIGLELATAFARLGTRVTVIDKSTRIGGIHDPDAEAVARAALADGIDFRLGAELTEAAPDGDGVRLAWDGDAAGDGRFDCVLAAAGRPPATDPLALATTGLALDADGIPDFDAATGRCCDSMIFIAGDIRGCRPVLHEAARSGRLAGHNAARPDAMRRSAILPPLAITFTDPQIALVGTAFDALPIDAVTGVATFQDNGRVHIDAAGPGILRLYAGHDGDILGATIVGPGAEHLAHLVAMACHSGLAVADLVDQASYHPTIAEVLQNAARSARDALAHADD